MPTETPAVTLPDSAPVAAPELEVPRGSRQYQDWRLSGVLPSTKADPAPAEVETAKQTEAPPSEDPAPSETLSETAAGSEPAPSQKRGKTKEDTERRFQELLADRRADRERIAELERKLTPTTSDKPDSQPAADLSTEPKIDDLDAKTGKPKYATIEDYLAAVRKYDREQLLQEVDARQSKAREQSAREEQQKVISQNWKAKVEEARKKHADFDAVALNDELPIPAGSVTDACVLDSEHGAEVLYHLAQNPDELTRISALNPLRQARELFQIEHKLSAAPPSLKRITQAPPPPHEVSGKGTTSTDEVEQALQEDDPRAYMAAANRRDLARRKGK
jgi:hypothetical protein